MEVVELGLAVEALELLVKDVVLVGRLELDLVVATDEVDVADVCRVVWTATWVVVVLAAAAVPCTH